MLCEVVWLGVSVYCLCYSLTPTSVKLPKPNGKPPSKVQLPPQEKCSSSPVRLPLPPFQWVWMILPILNKCVSDRQCLLAPQLPVALN